MRTTEVVASFMANCRLRELSPRTLRGYDCHTKRLIQLSPQFPPKPDIIQEFLATVQGPHNADSYYRTFRATDNYAHKRFGTANFMKSVTRPRVRREIQPVLTELNLNLLAWRVQDANPRDKAIIVFFLDTACRSGEGCGLKRKDILDDRVVIHGKTGYRVAPLSPVTRDLLLSLPAYEDGFVFHGTEGTRYANMPLGETGFYKIVKKYLILSGYDAGRRFGPQTLRVTHGVHHLRSGGNMRALQLIMGHTDIKTTADYYTPLLEEDVIEIHHKHSPGRVFENVSANAESE
ncbi:MAG: site-specific integrase [Dehalococcoidia bacterium]